MKKLFVYILSLNVIACSITPLPSSIHDDFGQTESDIKHAQKKMMTQQSEANYVTHVNGGYLGKHVIYQVTDEDLPPMFNNSFQLDKQFYGLRTIATTLTELTKIPTILDISGNDTMSNNTMNLDQCNDVRITQQDGTLVDLLNMIGARCDLAWSYKNGKLVLSDTETRTWNVRGIPGEIQVQNSINNNSGVQSQAGANGASTSGGAGGQATGTSQAAGQQSATQNTAFNLENSLWKNLEDAVSKQLSKVGKISISPSTSSLTVTDKPSVILRVDKFMEIQNSRMKRNVIIEVQLMSIDVHATDNYGINWNMVLTGNSTKFAINGQSVQTAATGINEFIPSPVFMPTSTTQAFTLGITSGSLSGSQFLVNALSTKTQGVLVTSTAVATMSNQPVPLQFIDQQAYLASVQTTQTAQVGSQTSLTPGQLTTGISLNILPVVEDDGKVSLQLSINISALKKMSQYTSQGASIQLPNTLQRNFMQKVVVKSGDAFVLTGFDSDNQAIINTGVGSPTNWFLGGGVSADKVRTRMVMIVTPLIIE